MSKELFELPEFHYFEEKNVFSGSVNNDFNYKIWYGEQFTVKVWYGSSCYSKTPTEDIVAEFSAEFKPESVETIKNWLSGQYNDYTKQSASGE